MADDAKEYRFVADLVPKLATMIHSDGFPNGDRAKLKRMSPEGRAPVSYYRFITRHVPEDLRFANDEPNWKALITGIALQHGNPHNPKVSFGQALAETGFSETRLESLLAADGRILRTLLVRAARRLAASRKACNWKHVAYLLFAGTDEFRERINRQIASGYFRAIPTDS